MSNRQMKTALAAAALAAINLPARSVLGRPGAEGGDRLSAVDPSTWAISWRRHVLEQPAELAGILVRQSQRRKHWASYTSPEHGK